MSMLDKTMKVETIIIGNMMYLKQEDKNWELKPMDSLQAANMKNKFANSQVQYFKNCQKLADSTIDGKTYRVYKGEFDMEKMLELVNDASKITDKSQKPKHDMEKLAQMGMKMTCFINAKDDLERMNITMEREGKAFETVMTYTYDVDVSIVAPSLEKKD